MQTINYGDCLYVCYGTSAGAAAFHLLVVGAAFYVAHKKQHFQHIDALPGVLFRSQVKRCRCQRKRKIEKLEIRFQSKVRNAERPRLSDWISGKIFRLCYYWTFTSNRSAIRAGIDSKTLSFIIRPLHLQTETCRASLPHDQTVNTT